MPPDAPFVLPPPPPDHGGRGRLRLGVVALSVGVLGVVTAGPFGALGAVPLVGLVYLTVWARRREVGAALAMAALDRAARGRFDEARAILDGVAKNVLTSYI